MEARITRFLESRMDMCGRGTLVMYGAYLRHYARWVADQVGAPLEPVTIRAYIVSRRADANATLRNRVRHLRALCTWLVEQGELDHSPFNGRNRVMMPARKRTYRRTYFQADVVALLGATAPTQWKRGVRASTRRQWQPDGPLAREALQCRALVLLLVDSAMRAGEAVALTCGQVRGEQLCIRSKGGHLDVAFVRAETRIVLQELAGDRPASDALFRDWHNRPCTVRGLRGALVRLARRASVTLPPRPLHAFRHYAARQWVKAKLPDLVIKQLMRHENLATTQIYTVLETDELAALHAEASSIPLLLERAGLRAAA